MLKYHTMNISSLKQDSRAIQYTSEIINETVLKNIKSLTISFGWGAAPRPRVSTDAISHKLINKRDISILFSTSLSKRVLELAIYSTKIIKNRFERGLDFI